MGNHYRLLLLLASGIAGVFIILGDSLTEFIQNAPSVTHVPYRIPFFLLLVCHNYFLISVIRQDG